MSCYCDGNCPSCSRKYWESELWRQLIDKEIDAIEYGIKLKALKEKYALR